MPPVLTVPLTITMHIKWLLIAVLPSSPRASVFGELIPEFPNIKCENPHKGATWLIYGSCRLAISSFVRSHTEPEHNLVRRLPIGPKELKCPATSPFLECTMLIDYDEPPRGFLSPRVQIHDIDRLGNRLARACVKNGGGNNGGQIGPIDNAGFAYVRLMPSDKVATESGVPYGELNDLGVAENAVIDQVRAPMHCDNNGKTPTSLKRFP